MRSLVVITLCLIASHVKGQTASTNQATSQDSLLQRNFVELNGVVMTADSLQYVPFANISSAKGYSTYASDMGVFSIVVPKGDTLSFSSPGYTTVQYTISPTLAGTRYSIIQLMVQDTFFLAETILRPAPTKEQFDYAFKYWEIPDDKYELARKNTEEATMRILRDNMPLDGREHQEQLKRMMMERKSWEGSIPPQRIFSPLAWADFISAWKRGDFKRKTKKKY
ncbi:MAG: hypothetical protein RL660_1481 [Bacteroidota bacterium]|jgi:hypothetical protein